ncbi:MAG: hypothetical protein V3U33_06355 [candidate division NC10 bacterium]
MVVSLGPFRWLGLVPICFGAAVAVWAESLAILLYLCLVMGVVWLYVVTIEEKGLEVRFHDAYLVYKERVPRWLPGLSRSPHS